MENGRKFGQQTNYGINQDYRPVGEIIIRPNGQIIYPGESRRASEPVPGTGKARRNSGQRNR